MLIFWFSTFVLEMLCFGLGFLWRARRAWAVLLSFMIIAAYAWLWRDLGWQFGSTLSVLGFLRVLNLLRIVKGRMHPSYLRQATGRTAWTMYKLHLLMLWLVTIPLVTWPARLLQVVVYLQLVLAVSVCLVTLNALRKLRFRMPKTYLVDRELPTVTVAIPARNETTDLADCLEMVLASDYPKLEVIVLDDCSQAKTAQIIKDFAQHGVRFVQGEVPAERWLAKNQAYHKLYEEANGELILFCGVDVRLGKQAIRNLVNVLHDRKKAMISVLPQRDRSTPAASLIQPMRYWWELALPRRLFNRPAVLSTCWLIDRKMLKKLGGFASVSHTLLPEGVFARELIKRDKYSFIRSTHDLDVRTVKSLRAQRHTAIRMRYPQLRRRPEWTMLMTLGEVTFLLGPFLLLFAQIWWPIEPYQYLAMVSAAVLVITHLLIVGVTNPANLPLALFNFPLAVLSELVLGNASMIQYEFFTVTWRERNICIPVMHVVPKLPSV